MIILDCTDEGEDLTLKWMADNCDQVMQLVQGSGPIEKAYGLKAYPDEIWATKWQRDNILTSILGGPWKHYRGVPIKTYDSADDTGSLEDTTGLPTKLDPHT